MPRYRFPIALVLSLALPGTALAGRPALIIPTNPATVIETLPRGYASIMPRTSTGGKPAPVSEIGQLLEVSARTGDARLAARAQALLDRYPATDKSPQILHLRAFSAQHRHDFTGALRFLDEAIAREPRDGDARLSRAQVHLVQGRLDLARADCVALAFGVDSGRGLLCIAALSLRRGNLGVAASLVDRWLAQAAAADPSREYVLVMRAEIASRAGAPDADAWFAKALAAAPADVRVLAAAARHLRATGRSAEVMKLLSNASSDGLQLQRALAAHSARLPQAAALADAQGRRYQLAHELGSQPEMRDEAEFLLTLRGNAPAALALAVRNFTQQRDYEDVSVLRRAAAAAGRPQALAGLQAWAASQQVSLTPVPGSAR